MSKKDMGTELKHVFAVTLFILGFLASMDMVLWGIISSEPISLLLGSGNIFARIALFLLGAGLICHPIFKAWDMVKGAVKSTLFGYITSVAVVLGAAVIIAFSIYGYDLILPATGKTIAYQAILVVFGILSFLEVYAPIATS